MDTLSFFILVVVAWNAKADDAEVPQYITNLINEVKQLKDENKNLHEDMANLKLTRASYQDLQKYSEGIQSEMYHVTQSNKELKLSNIELKQSNIELKQSNIELKQSNKELKEDIGTLKMESMNKITIESFKTRITRNENFAGFTAYPTQTRDFNGGDKVTFDAVTGNYGGYYNIEDSSFTCPITAYYMFYVSVYSLEDRGMDADIYQEGVGALIGTESTDGHDVGSNMVITHCEANQRVWIVCPTDGRQMHIGLRGTQRWSSFSGALLAM